MAKWGFGTWDSAGRDTNTGIVRILSAGTLVVTNGQKSGSFTFAVPPGYVLDYNFQANMDAPPQGRRRISISGNTATIVAAGDTDYSAGSLQAFAGTFLFFVRK
ncbi:hypothetical protein [Pantoea vagans]|jgi:hypothetical protein|uniref:hypothetical protein n=1 Tax=Pantoea vagans TaxID=470934 RepID=UPI00320A6F6D